VVRIGINASGGDFGDQVVRTAVASVAKDNPTLGINFYSQNHIVDLVWENLKMIKCGSASDELRRMLKDMAEGKINAIITATQSSRLLVAINDYLLSGVKRPGLIAPFPTRSEYKLSYIMDVGATAKVDDPEVFSGWAHLGTDFIVSQAGIAHPRIGLGNIASERACPVISAIDKRLRNIPGYVGYVEPKDFIGGKVDLLLTDGFAGNWTLKWTEYYLDFVFDKLIELIGEKPGNSDMKEVIEQQQQKYLSYDAHLVSPLLGVEGGTVFRVHGAATSEQIAKAFIVVNTRYKLG